MKKIKKLLSVFLVLTIFFTTLPVTEVFAASKPSAPSITVTTGDSALTVKWKKIKNVTGYRIYYTTDSNFKKNIKNIDTSKTSYTIKKLKSYTRYYVKVRAYTKKKGKPRVYSSYSSKKSIVTNVRPTSIKSITGEQAVVKISYSAASKVSGYQIQYSTRSDFKTANSIKTTSTSYMIKQLGGADGSAVKYYVRVRTYKKHNGKTTYSDWSTSKSVTTKKVTLPSKVYINSVSTTSNGSNASIEINTFNYDKITTGYQVILATDNHFKSTVTNGKTISKNPITITGLKLNTVYYYKIRAVRNLNGKEYYSSWLIPENNAIKTEGAYAIFNPSIDSVVLTNDNTECAVRWSAPNTDYDSISYVLQYSTTSAFSDADTVSVNTTANNYKFTTKYNNTYYIRAQGVIKKGEQSHKTGWSSTTNINVLDPYAIDSAPVISSVSSTKNSITLSWNSVANATNYVVSYSTDKSFTTKIDIKTSTKTITLSDLTSDTTYYLKVKATNSKNSSAYSSVKSVKTASEKINEGVNIKHSTWAKEYVADKPFLFGYQLYIDYYENEKKANEYVTMLKKAYLEVGITSDMNDVERLLAITKWMQSNLRYDSDLIKLDCYDALKYGKCVCEGTAELFNDLCYLADIPCFYIAGGNHAENIIKIQGYWYTADPSVMLGFNHCTKAYPGISIYSEEFENALMDTEALGNASMGLSCAKTLEGWDNITDSWDAPFREMFNSSTCQPHAIRDNLVTDEMRTLVHDGFYKVAKIKTGCRNSSAKSKYDSMDIDYTDLIGCGYF